MSQRSNPKKQRVEKKEDGLVKSYTKDGKLEAEITYKDGKRNGIARNYFRKGFENSGNQLIHWSSLHEVFSTDYLNFEV